MKTDCGTAQKYPNDQVILLTAWSEETHKLVKAWRGRVPSMVDRMMLHYLLRYQQELTTQLLRNEK